MNNTSTIFNQLLTFIPKSHFKAFVGQHNGDRYTKKLTTWNQLVVLMYAQATHKESLRDIETSFNTHKNNWYHLGVKSVSKSSLARACKQREYQIFEKLFYVILQQCKDVVPSKEFSFKNPLYSLDATTIRLCLSVFNWASYTQTKGALKLHTLIDNGTMMPEVIVSSNGKKGDLTGAKEMQLHKKLEKGSIVVFDRAYIDYSWWKQLNDSGLYFVSRTKKNQNIIVNGVHKEPVGAGVIADAGYDSEKSHVFVRNLNIRTIIPPKIGRRSDKLPTGKWRKIMATRFNLKLYGQRWQAETVNSMIKRNLGSALRARSYWTQCHEMMLRVFVHNVAIV